MSKKILSILLALSLLAGAMCCWSLNSVAETGYTLKEISKADEGNAAWLDAVMANKYNAIAGLNPTFENGTPTGYDAGHLKYVTDHNIPGITGGTTSDQKIFWDLSKSSYISYDLGSEQQVTDVLVATYCTSLVAGTGWEGLGDITLYLSNDVNTLTDEANKVATAKLYYGGLLTLTTPQTARYVTIAIASKTQNNGGYARISELGVYVTKSYAKRIINSVDDAAWVKEAMAQYNAAYGLTATVSVTSTANEKKYMTDNVIPGITDTTITDNNHKFYFSTPGYLVYDLGSVMSVKSLLIAGSKGEIDSGAASALGTFEVYMGNNSVAAELVADANSLVATETLDAKGSEYGVLLTLNAPVEAQYVAVKFTHSKGARISELGVYGDFSVTTLTDTDDAEYATGVMNAINVAKDTDYKLYTYANGTFTYATTVSDTKKAMMDGVIPGVVGEYDSNNNYNKGGWASGASRYLIIDFGNTASIENILIAGAKKTENTDFGTALVCFSDDMATLLSAPKTKYELSITTFGAVITPTNPVSARYALLNVTGANSDYARVTELGFYSSQPVAVDREGYTAVRFAYDGYGDYVTDVMKADNLLAGLTPKTYTNDSTAGNVSGTASHLTDASINGITNELTTDQKVHWNSGTSPWLYYDLGGWYDVQSLVVAGSYPELVNYTYTLGSVEVYMSDSQDTLATTKVMTESDIRIGAVLTLNAPKQVRYIAIKFLASYARVTELGVYAANPVKALGASVRDPQAAEKLALRFGFDMTAVGVEYAGDSREEDKYARGELTNATVKLEGKEYKLVDFGAIVSNDANNVMQLDSVDLKTKKVPANNLFEVKDNGAVYTAVVKDIPNDKADIKIRARMYLQVTDMNGDNPQTIYGSIISRSVSESSNGFI